MFWNLLHGETCTQGHTYDFAIHFGAHVAQIWFLHIKSLGNQSMYKNSRMMSVFLNFNTTLLWSGSTLRVVNLRVGLLIILWVIYATSKSWIGYLKH